MRTGTMISLGASAMLGLGALIVARVWLPQANHASHDKTAETVTAGVPVVVASVDIPYGTKLDAGRLIVVRLPQAAAPQGAYSDPGQILKQAGGPPIALTPIAAHEALLPSKLSGGGARPTVSAIITEGMRAYTIGVTEVAGGGGHVLPGDRVDVVLTHDPAAGADRTAPGHGMVSDVVLQNVRVLGMDLNADPSSTQAAAAHTATLEVSVQDAEKLALAAQAGSLSLALRRTGNAEVAPVRTVAVTDLGSVGPRAARARTPGGAQLIDASQRRTGRRPSVVIVRRSIIVVHGDAASSVEVPAERFGAGA